AGSSETNLGSLKGFYWTAGTFHSWGKNKVASGGLLVIDAGLGPLTTFHTDFSAPGSAQTSDEAQGASGDSGSGVFQLNGTNWVLVGVVDAVSTATGQPANSAAYGNFTYIADIPTYRNQILSIIGRTGLPWLSLPEVAGS